MTSISMVSIQEKNLSSAWLKTLQAVRATPDGAQFHAVTHITQPTCEDPCIRSAADRLLLELGLDSIETVANTIFPARMAATSPSMEVLVDRYRAILPTLRRIHHNNQRGTYFGRIVAYDTGAGVINQLGALIVKLRQELANTAPKTARYEIGLDQPEDLDPASPHCSATAMPIYTPGRDNAIMGFPCLSLCSFQLDASQLHVVAHYRSQRLMQRGYGNYLGVARLLDYIARSCDLEPGAMTVVAGRADADVAKYRLNAMVASLATSGDPDSGGQDI
jgi:hypothetical protein